MSDNQARERLQNALQAIEKRIVALQARPDREEIEALKNEREQDLETIRKLRADIEEIRRNS